MGFATGNYLTRSTVYDFLLTKKMSLTLIMLLFIMIYFAFYNFSSMFDPGSQKHFMLNSVIYLYVLCFFMGIPSGVVYSVFLYRANGGKSQEYLAQFSHDPPSAKDLNENQMEMTANLVLIAIDAGSLVANLLCAIVILGFYPE
jgi:hypothetical protein